jgi:hypothetical protein
VTKLGNLNSQGEPMPKLEHRPHGRGDEELATIRALRGRSRSICVRRFLKESSTKLSVEPVLDVVSSVGFG